MGTKWTEEENALLKVVIKSGEGLTYQQIAERMENARSERTLQSTRWRYTKSAVERQALVLGLVKTRALPWTREEEAYLLELDATGEFSQTQMAEALQTHFGHLRNYARQRIQERLKYLKRHSDSSIQGVERPPSVRPGSRSPSRQSLLNRQGPSSAAPRSESASRRAHTRSEPQFDDEQEQKRLRDNLLQILTDPSVPSTSRNWFESSYSNSSATGSGASRSSSQDRGRQSPLQGSSSRLSSSQVGTTHPPARSVMHQEWTQEPQTFLPALTSKRTRSPSPAPAQSHPAPLRREVSRALPPLAARPDGTSSQRESDLGLGLASFSGGRSTGRPSPSGTRSPIWYSLDPRQAHSTTATSHPSSQRERSDSSLGRVGELPDLSHSSYATVSPPTTYGSSPHSPHFHHNVGHVSTRNYNLESTPASSSVRYDKSGNLITGVRSSTNTSHPNARYNEKYPTYRNNSLGQYVPRHHTQENSSPKTKEGDTKATFRESHCHSDSGSDA